MTSIKITDEQNLELIDIALNAGYNSSYEYVLDVFNGRKFLNGNYAVEFDNDEDASWFLLNL